MSREIYITEIDKEKLKKLIENALHSNIKNKAIEELSLELNKALVIDPRKVPPNVVTMNSKVKLVLNGEEKEIQLVFPQEAEPFKNKVSVLSPIGTAIIGYAVDDTIEWDTPSGKSKIIIKEILYQPEAAGDFE